MIFTWNNQVFIVQIGSDFIHKDSTSLFNFRVYSLLYNLFKNPMASSWQNPVHETDNQKDSSLLILQKENYVKS